MALNDFTVTNIGKVGDFAESAGSAIDQPNGIRLLLTASGLGVHLKRVLLKITNTAAAPYAVTFEHSSHAQDVTDQVTAAIPAGGGVRWCRLRSDLVQGDSTVWIKLPGRDDRRDHRLQPRGMTGAARVALTGHPHVRPSADCLIALLLKRGGTPKVA